jgi:AcrR family transcriptional regulator
MTNTVAKKRVSKSDWLEKALDFLEQDGLEAVKIDSLARTLKTSRSGFYWHFKDRGGLIRAMAEYWEEEFTNVVTSNKLVAKAEPRERLYIIMKMVLENNLARLDFPMRIAAEEDSVVMETFDRVIQKRLAFLRSTFSELGFTGEELEMRTHMFVCYHSWEGTHFHNSSMATRAKWLKQRHEFFCSSPNRAD